MKFLLLSSLLSNKINHPDICKTREELFISLFRTEINNEYANNYNIELIIDTFKNVNQIVDYALIIGYNDDINIYYNNLKKFVKHKILLVTFDGKYNNLFDIVFSFNPSYLPHDQLYIKPPLNKNIYTSNKDSNIIYISFNKPCNLMKFKDTHIKLILTKLEKLTAQNIKFKVSMIDHLSIDYIDSSFNILESRKFNNYIDYINEISKINIFFISFKYHVDIFQLYELSMCNVLILYNGNILNKNIIDELKIFTYNDNFEWSDIFNITNEYDNLQNNNYTWHNFITTMFDYICNKIDHKIDNKIDNKMDNKIDNKMETQTEHINNNMINILNIKNPNKPIINKMANIQLNNKITENKKNKKQILLQSHINNYK